jgi:hypothetical protein
LTGPAPALTRATESVTIQGLGFFDFAHGQDGVAPNAIELHPVTGIAFGGSAPRQCHHRADHTVEQDSSPWTRSSSSACTCCSSWK